MTKKILLCLCLSLLLFAGCGTKNKSSLKQPPPPAIPHIIAVAPVISKATDPLISRIVRQKAIDSLYFKGYPRIEARAIDERLARLYGDMSFASENIPPKVIGELTGAEGVLYCTVKGMKTSYFLMYAPTYIELSFELRNANTGETVWQASRRSTERNFGFTKKELENKTFIDYEAAIDDIFNKTLAKFPEGPGLILIPSDGMP
ncbi:MAG: DUF799 family lipoprotein [Syntrophobacterales bacterium]|nr:DUF799 family lipoprotein [Syntrophobacterales bacterium]